MFASVFALVAVPLLAQSVSAGCARQYTVQAGDYCDAISAAKNVSTYQLGTVNPSINENCDNLLPGQQLCLGNDGEDCSTTYIVKAGDTCGDIQHNHGINSTLLYGNNPQINSECTNIYIGEVLCVAGGFAAPPPGPTIPATVVPPSATPAIPTSEAAPSPTHTSVAPASTPTSVAPASTPTPSGSDDGDDDDDDEDCEDDEDDDY